MSVDIGEKIKEFVDVDATYRTIQASRKQLREDVKKILVDSKSSRIKYGKVNIRPKTIKRRKSVPTEKILELLAGQLAEDPRTQLLTSGIIKRLKDSIDSCRVLVVSTSLEVKIVDD